MKHKIAWGDETHENRNDVEKAIEEFCIQRLCDGDCGSVTIGKRHYNIAVKATLVESFDKADFRVVTMEVTGKPSCKDDAEVPGRYEIGVPDRFKDARAANCALDVFHSNVAVKVLDDFCFTVKYNGQVLKPGSRKSYADASAGTFMGRA